MEIYFYVKLYIIITIMNYAEKITSQWLFKSSNIKIIFLR